jgi:hypothetical protein
MSPSEKRRAPHEGRRPESEVARAARAAEEGQQLFLPCLPVPQPRPAVDMVQIRRIAYV